MQNATHIISCDGGLRHAEAMGIWPNVVIGDLDSAPSAALSACRAKGIPIHIHPTDKEDTDLALAMTYALENYISSITIVGALGGHADHQIANFHVLDTAKGIPAEIWDENTSAQLIHGFLCISKEDYQTISLIPLSTEVAGIKTQGLVYPLSGETLRLGVVRGVSNSFCASGAMITVESGVLFAIRCRKG